MPYGGQLWFPGGGGTQQPTRNEQWGGPNTVFPMPYAPDATIIGAGPVGTPPIHTGPTGAPNTSPSTTPDNRPHSGMVWIDPATGRPGTPPPGSTVPTTTAPTTTPPTSPFAGSSQPQTGPGSWMQRILTLMGGPQGSWGSQFPYMSQDANFSYDPYY